MHPQGIQMENENHWGNWINQVQLEYGRKNGVRLRVCKHYD